MPVPTKWMMSVEGGGRDTAPDADADPLLVNAREHRAALRALGGGGLIQLVAGGADGEG